MGFVTADIRKSFAENKKTMGLFAKKDAGLTLALLKTQLAVYLVDISFGQVANFDKNVVLFEEDHFMLSGRLREARDFLALLVEVKDRSIALPPAAVAQLRRINDTVSRGAQYEDTPFDAIIMSDYYYLVARLAPSTRGLLADAVAGHSGRVE